METTTLSTLVDLLKQPRTLSKNSPKKECDNEQKQTTIFDLDNSDRFKVLKLIEELLDSQEETDKLRNKLEEEKSEFREKRNKLLKKLDAVNEKYEKALMDIQMLKEAHAESLNKLEEKITTVSTKFEASFEEIIELRKSNAELKKENLALRKLNCGSTVSATMIQEENSRLTMQLERNRVKEKTLKKQLKNLSNRFNLNPEYNNPSASSSSSTLQGIISSQQQSLQQDQNQHVSITRNNSVNSINRGVGAGDCGGDCDLAPPPDVNTIKAPAKGGFQEYGNSTFAFPNNSNYVVQQQLQQFQSNNSALASLEDMAILENLFFRF